MRNRTIGIGLLLGGLVVVGLGVATQAKAQRGREEAAWEYKVATFSYNPGENLNDSQRASFYEKTLNDQARQGWEPVGSMLTRSTVQTVGGGVTTRDSVSFVAFRRPKR